MMSSLRSMCKWIWDFNPVHPTGFSSFIKMQHYPFKETFRLHIQPVSCSLKISSGISMVSELLSLACAVM